MIYLAPTVMALPLASKLLIPDMWICTAITYMMSEIAVRKKCIMPFIIPAVQIQATKRLHGTPFTMFWAVAVSKYMLMEDRP